MVKWILYPPAVRDGWLGIKIFKMNDLTCCVAATINLTLLKNWIKALQKYSCYHFCKKEKLQHLFKPVASNFMEIKANKIVCQSDWLPSYNKLAIAYRRQDRSTCLFWVGSDEDEWWEKCAKTKNTTSIPQCQSRQSLYTFSHSGVRHNMVYPHHSVNEWAMHSTTTTTLGRCSANQHC